MKTYKFKTNINCGGCQATVAPHLDSLKEVEKWQVDTGDKRKILTVHSNGASRKEVIDAVQKAGFAIEPLRKGLPGILK